MAIEIQRSLSLNQGRYSRKTEIDAIILENCALAQITSRLLSVFVTLRGAQSAILSTSVAYNHALSFKMLTPIYLPICE